MQGPVEPKAFSPDFSSVEDEGESSDYESAMVDTSHDTKFVDYDHETSKYFGKSSTIGLFRAVMDLKQERYPGTKSPHVPIFGFFGSRRREFWEPNPVRMHIFGEPTTGF